MLHDLHCPAVPSCPALLYSAGNIDYSVLERYDYVYRRRFCNMDNARLRSIRHSRYDHPAAGSGTSDSRDTDSNANRVINNLSALTAKNAYGQCVIADHTIYEMDRSYRGHARTGCACLYCVPAPWHSPAAGFSEWALYRDQTTVIASVIGLTAMILIYMYIRKGRVAVSYIIGDHDGSSVTSPGRVLFVGKLHVYTRTQRQLATCQHLTLIRWTQDKNIHVSSCNDNHH